MHEYVLTRVFFFLPFMASSKQACVWVNYYLKHPFVVVLAFRRIDINYNSKSNLKCQFKILQFEIAHPSIIRSIK